MSKEITIETHDLSIGYPLNRREKKVIHTALNLQLFAGEVTCLLGLNGCGKSTLLKTLCGFLPPLSGNVTICDKPICQYSQNQLSTLVGVVLTEKSSAGGITVYELVSLGRYPHTDFFGRLKPEDHNIIKNSLQAVGILDKADRFVAELSDGERQKAFIAKALSQECPIIILDEPTAFLDVTSKVETMQLLGNLASTQGKSILLSTHDLDLAIRTSDRLWLLSSPTNSISATSAVTTQDTTSAPATAGSENASACEKQSDRKKPQQLTCGTPQHLTCDPPQQLTCGTPQQLTCGTPQQLIAEGAFQQYFHLNIDPTGSIYANL